MNVPKNKRLFLPPVILYLNPTLCTFFIVIQRLLQCYLNLYNILNKYSSIGTQIHVLIQTLYGLKALLYLKRQKSKQAAKNSDYSNLPSVCHLLNIV
jgi:hypothetical protein